MIVSLFNKNKDGYYGFYGSRKKEAPYSYCRVPLTNLAGKRIAIDMASLIYVMSAPVISMVTDRTNLIVEEPDRNEINRQIIHKVLERLEIYLYYNIQVICCFDSKPNPLKDKTKRNADHEKKVNEYNAARTALYSADPLLRHALVERYKRAYKANIKPPKEFVEHIQHLLYAIGFPVLKASDYFGEFNGDGEALAATLCMGGNDYCAAAATNDSDFHAYGGNWAIIDIETEPTTVNNVRITMHYANMRSLEAIINQMNIPFSTFLDICIMLGNDFNDRIPGVGPVNIMKLIKQHGSIEAISRIKDVRILNYHNVLPIFNSSRIKITPPQLDFDVKRFNDSCRHPIRKSILSEEGLQSHVKDIADLPMVSGSEYKPETVSIVPIVPGQSREIEL